MSQHGADLIWLIQREALEALPAMQARVDAQLAALGQPSAEIDASCRTPSGAAITALYRLPGPEPANLIERQNELAVITIEGPMSRGWTPSHALRQMASTDVLAAAVRKAAADETVAGILLIVNSPGGGSFGLADLADAIENAASVKPVVALASGLMASAAYWACSAATRIYAEPGALVGSIGAMNVVYDHSRMLANQGVDVHVIATGKFKGSGVFGAKVTEEQVSYLQALFQQSHDQFVAQVSRMRKIDPARVQAVADGRVFYAPEAQAAGLIDGTVMNETKASEVLRALIQASPLPAAGRGGNKERVRMSTQGDAAPKAATIKELKAAMPQADGDFLVKCQEDELTVPQALSRYCNQLDQQNRDQATASAAKIAELEGRLTAATQSGPPRASAPAIDKARNSGAVGGPPATPAAETYEDKVQALVSLGMKKHEAVNHVNRHFPELRREMIERVNTRSA